MTNPRTGHSRRDVLRTSGIITGMLVGGSAVSASALAQEGTGADKSGKFRLANTATIVPEPGVRPINHVLEIDTSADGLYGSASRSLHVTAEQLDGKLSFDYFIESGDCGGGSPRLILSVDNDGDGEHDFWLVTDGSGSPGWASCPDAADMWDHFDATDDGDTYWRKHPDSSGYHTWTDAKSLLGSNHMILSGALVDDSYWKASAAGITYYDNIQIGDRTLSGHSDVVGEQ